MTATNKKSDYSKYADKNQEQLYKKFSPDTFMGNESNMNHLFLWVTFFRRNLHRFVKDYLGIDLYWYQSILIYLMGVSDKICVIASRASAKSFIVALFACVRAILYPGTRVVIASPTRSQSKLLISEKISKELCNMSPVLKKEISLIKDNQNEIAVIFKNGSSIIVVTASDTARGTRSHVNIEDEFRLIDPKVSEAILEPFLIIRQPPYKKNSFYSQIKCLREEPIDIRITSSFFDTSWIWKIGDIVFKDMLDGKPSCMLCFDEMIALMHDIKSQAYFQSARKKQSDFNFRLEILNERIKENTSSFFTYKMLNDNQRCRQPFYPRKTEDFRMGKKNPYAIARQPDEVRIVSADLAFVHASGNDNSCFCCIRLLPETTTYKGENSETIVDNGYRAIVCYITTVQGGNVLDQSIMLRRLMDDFDSDYLVLDTRNSGIAVLDSLQKVSYDDERKVEYSALSCMNNEGLANRAHVDGRECIYAVNGTAKLNNDIAINFRDILEQKKVDFLIPFDKAQEDIFPTNKDYISTPDASVQNFYEAPFLETTALIDECISLTYERKELTGAIVLRESGSKTKDRYISLAYGLMFKKLLEQDLMQNAKDYEYSTFIN